MADNPITGETPLLIGGTEYTLQYTWRELVEIKKKFGKDVDLFDPEVLAPLLVIGLKRHHPDITEDELFEKSPPVTRVIQAVNKALGRTYVGEDAPTAGQKNPLQMLEETAKQIQEMESTASPEPSSTPTASASDQPSSGT